MASEKIDNKKALKKQKLLSSAFSLFIEKGINETTIQDIVNASGLAKGTFYLYFKDKYDIQDELIVIESKKIFDEAINALSKTKITDFKEKIIFIIDYIIGILSKNALLLKFISKNLSWGLYHEKVNNIVGNNALGAKEKFLNLTKEANIKLKNPEVTLYMIVELVSSTAYASITKKEPLSIKKFKPFLYDAIRKLLEE